MNTFMGSTRFRRSTDFRRQGPSEEVAHKAVLWLALRAVFTGTSPYLVGQLSEAKDYTDWLRPVHWAELLSNQPGVQLLTGLWNFF